MKPGLLRATGHMLVRPEIEEIANAFHQVTDDQLEEMFTQFHTMYEVDRTVTREHMRFAAQAAVAYDTIIHKYDIAAFGYYWWGEDELITQLRAQSGLAVSRLAALGRPGVTEGDVKTAMAMKILDLLGGGGMFVEFFAMDFEENSILMGHDGPSNISVAQGSPRLMHLDTHHGKSGHGLGIDFDMPEGPRDPAEPDPVRCRGYVQAHLCHRGNHSRHHSADWQPQRPGANAAAPARVH